jgi:hypothetical protein
VVGVQLSGSELDLGGLSLSIDPFQEIAQRQSEGIRQSRQMSEPHLARAPFQIRDMNLMDSSLLG